MRLGGVKLTLSVAGIILGFSSTIGSGSGAGAGAGAGSGAGAGAGAGVASTAVITSFIAS